MNSDVCASDLLVFDVPTTWGVPTRLRLSISMCQQFSPAGECTSRLSWWIRNQPVLAPMLEWKNTLMFPIYLFGPGLCAQARGPLCFVGVHGEHSRI